MPLNDPVPSNAPDVLLRNAQDFDKLINSSGNHTNRVGNSLPSYIQAIAELGFDAPVLFASGIVVDSSRKTVEYSGARYFAKPSAVPFTTTATFNPAQWQMFDQQFAGAEIAQIGTYSLLRAYAGAATLVYVAGRTNDQDGAAGVFAVDESDTASADNGGTILVDSIGRRWKRQAASVTVQMFGAVGGGVVNDSTAFHALELACAGKRIDLLGKQYLVSAIPTQCQYYNGDFIVGSSRVSLRKNPLDNPLDGNSWLAIGDGLTHYWLFGFVYLESSGKMLAFVESAARHGESFGASLNVLTSDDRGASWRGERSIYAVNGLDIAHAAVGLMASGRIGMVVYVKSAGSSIYRNDFVYSDDGGVTWNSNANIVANVAFTYGDMMQYPAAAGGNDSTGFAVYGYAGAGIRTLTTVDNGNTWASITSIGAGAVEPSVVRVPNQSKWVMFIRYDGGNLKVSTSTDMKNWTAPTDTGYALGSNPVYAVVANGRLFVYCYFRDYSATPAGIENQVVVFEESIEAVYDASNLVNKAPRVISDGIERNVGYLCIRQIGSDFIWGYTTGENQSSTNSASASSIVFGSTRRVPSIGFSYAADKENQNIFRNPTFELWSRGTSFPNLTAAAKVADLWSYIPSGATATISRVELTPEQSILFPFNPHYAMSFITSTPNDFAGIYQQFNGVDELFRFSERTISFQIHGIGIVPSGALPELPRLSILFNYGTGGSATSTLITYVRFVESANNVWRGEATMICPTAVGKTIGANPYVRVQFDSQSSSSWNTLICGVKAEFNSFCTRFSSVDYNAEKARCERFVRRINLESNDAVCMVAGQNATTGVGLVSFPDMVGAPNVSLVTGSPSDFEIYGGAGVTDLSWQNSGDRAVALVATTTGLTTAGSYMLRLKSGVSAAILLDAES